MSGQDPAALREELVDLVRRALVAADALCLHLAASRLDQALIELTGTGMPPRLSATDDDDTATVPPGGSPRPAPSPPGVILPGRFRFAPSRRGPRLH